MTDEKQREALQEAIEELTPLMGYCTDAFHEHHSVQYQAADYVATHMYTLHSALTAALATRQQVDAWQLIETAPLDKWVLMYFISSTPDNKHAHCVTMGQLSSYEAGKIWTASGVYQDLLAYTHWMPLPQPPTLTPKVADNAS